MLLKHLSLKGGRCFYFVSFIFCILTATSNLSPTLSALSITFYVVSATFYVLSATSEPIPHFDCSIHHFSRFIRYFSCSNCYFKTYPPLCLLYSPLFKFYPLLSILYPLTWNYPLFSSIFILESPTIPRWLTINNLANFQKSPCSSLVSMLNW